MAFLLENVKNLRSHDKGRTFRIINAHLESMGYKVYSKILNSLDYGVPQNRERIFIVGFLENVHFEFPSPVDDDKRLTLADILEKNVDRKYYVRDTIKNSQELMLYRMQQNIWSNLTLFFPKMCVRIISVCLLRDMLWQNPL